MLSRHILGQDEKQVDLLGSPRRDSLKISPEGCRNRGTPASRRTDRRSASDAFARGMVPGALNRNRPMTTRRAACSCGQLHLAIEGEPMRIWICHCLECQRRTGAVIGNLARFRREQITFNGTATAWKRTGESSNTLTCYFCPTCGSTIYFENEAFP